MKKKTVFGICDCITGIKPTCSVTEIRQSKAFLLTRKHRTTNAHTDQTACYENYIEHKQISRDETRTVKTFRPFIVCFVFLFVCMCVLFR